MKKVSYIFLLLILHQQLSARNRFNEILPNNAVTLQYAGSIGFLSIGFSKVSAKKRLEFGLLYGNLPKAHGGLIQSLSFKFTYNPFHIHINKKIILEPIQTGIIICQNFGENLEITWGNQYPKGYYWWNRSLRFHFFMSTQISFQLNKKIDKIACYIEANTNDLYLYSWAPNRETISIYDIFFLGAGLKFYF